MGLYQLTTRLEFWEPLEMCKYFINIPLYTVVLCYLRSLYIPENIEKTDYLGKPHLVVRKNSFSIFDNRLLID